MAQDAAWHPKSGPQRPKAQWEIDEEMEALMIDEAKVDDEATEINENEPLTININYNYIFCQIFLELF